LGEKPPKSAEKGAKNIFVKRKKGAKGVPTKTKILFAGYLWKDKKVSFLGSFWRAK
jgi:hypothetical protein